MDTYKTSFTLSYEDLGEQQVKDISTPVRYVRAGAPSLR